MKLFLALALTLASLTLSPEELTLAGLRLGDPPQRVEQLLGKPTSTSILHGIGLPLWLYPSKGIEVAFTAKEGVPQEAIWVRVTPPFRGQTERGIRLGAPEPLVYKRYGSLKRTQGRDSLEFGIMRGRVRQILLKREP